jgi:hypothetical protein
MATTRPDHRAVVAAVLLVVAAALGAGSAGRPGALHVVRPGETCASVARAAGLTVGQFDHVAQPERHLRRDVPRPVGLRPRLRHWLTADRLRRSPHAAHRPGFCMQLAVLPVTTVLAAYYSVCLYVK